MSARVSVACLRLGDRRADTGVCPYTLLGSFLCRRWAFPFAGAGRLLAFERSWLPVVGAAPRVCPYFGVLSAAWGWRADTGGCPYAWLSWLWVGALALAKRVFSYHRTPAPQYPRIPYLVPPNSAPPYPRIPHHRFTAAKLRRKTNSKKCDYPETAFCLHYLTNRG